MFDRTGDCMGVGDEEIDEVSVSPMVVSYEILLRLCVNILTILAFNLIIFVVMHVSFVRILLVSVIMGFVYGVIYPFGDDINGRIVGYHIYHKNSCMVD